MNKLGKSLIGIVLVLFIIGGVLFLFVDVEKYEGIIENINPLNLVGVIEAAYTDSTDFSKGVNNQTSSGTGDVQLTGSYLNGYFYSSEIDLGSSRSIGNVSFVSTQPSGTDIQIQLRTHNLSNGSGLMQDLQAYWKFDSEEVLDYSGNGLDGQSTSNHEISSRCGTEFVGVYNECSLYTNHYSSHGDAEGAAYMTTNKMSITNDFTLSAWVYIGSNDNADIIRRGQYVYPFWLRVDRNYGIQFVTRKSSTNYMRSPKYLFGLDEWVHVVAVLDGNVKYIYVNGVQVDSQSHSGGSLNVKTGQNTIIGDGNDVISIDDVAIWDRALSGGEIEDLYNDGELMPYSDWSQEYDGPFNTVSDAGVGQIVQYRARFERANAGQVVELDSVQIGHDLPGPAVPPYVDDYPTTTLITDNYESWNTRNVTLNATGFDAINITNMSLFTNTTGTWHMNQSTILGHVTGAQLNFTVLNVSDGGYIWNVLTCDNSTAVQCSFATNNLTFEVSAKVLTDVDCYPYMLDTGNNQCYTSCNSHTQVNSSSYCNWQGYAAVAKENGEFCGGSTVYPGLSDDEACTNQTTAYCYNDNIGIPSDYCTDDLTGCVDDYNEYAQGTIRCGILGDGNDYVICEGGDVINPWSLPIEGVQQDCGDGGTGYDSSATRTDHTYCGYNNPEICSETVGCMFQGTSDCGSYYFNETAGMCGDDVPNTNLTYACDRGCGAIYDYTNCPVGLSEDCNSCTPPAGEPDDPPFVEMVYPNDNATLLDLSVTHTYTVFEDHKLFNCSLWYQTDSISWGSQVLNTSEIIHDGFTSNSFSETYVDNANITWNVGCRDNMTNFSFAGPNRTLKIDFTYTDAFHVLEVYNGTEDSTPLFTINENGEVNISSHTYVDGNLYISSGHNVTSFSPVIMPELTISQYIDIDDDDYLKVRITNPHNEHIKFEGHNAIGDLLIGLFDRDPIISSESGDEIIIEDILRVSSFINVTANATRESNKTGIYSHVSTSINDAAAIAGIMDATGNQLAGYNFYGGYFRAEGGSLISPASALFADGVNTNYGYAGFFVGNVSIDKGNLEIQAGGLCITDDGSCTPVEGRLTVKDTINTGGESGYAYNMLGGAGCTLASTSFGSDDTCFRDDIGIGDDLYFDSGGGIAIDGSSSHSIKFSSSGLTYYNGTSYFVGSNYNNADVRVLGDLNVTSDLYVNGIHANDYLYNQTTAVDTSDFIVNNSNAVLYNITVNNITTNEGVLIDDGIEFLTASGTDEPIMRFRDSSGNLDTVMSRNFPSNAITIGDIMDNDGNVYLYAGGYHLTVNHTGLIGIGTTTPTHELTLSGIMNISSAVMFNTTQSQIRQVNNDLYIEADDELFLRPDDNLGIQVGSTNYAWFWGGEKALKIGAGAATNPGSNYGLVVEDNVNFTGNMELTNLTLWSVTGNATINDLILEGGDIHSGSNNIRIDPKTGAGTVIIGDGSADNEGDDLLVPDGNVKICSSGTCPSPNYATADGELYVEGDLEVDSNAYMAGSSGGSKYWTGADIVESLHTKETWKIRELCGKDEQCYISETSEDVGYGDVMCIDPEVGQTIRLCQEPESDLVIGVISDTYVLSIGRAEGYPIAIAGIAYTWCTNENGDIEPGMLMTSSSKGGYAMKASEDTPDGTILGKAFDFCDKDSCKIPIVVALN